MKIFLLILICVPIFLSSLFPQINATRYEYHLIQRSPAASLSKIGVASWLAGNSGVTDEGFLSASFNNPGAFRLESLKASIEFTYRAKTRYFDVMDYDGIVYPSFVSVGYGDRQMSVGITYAQYYSQYLESDGVEITTVDQPEGTGEFLTITEDIKIHSFAATLQYTFLENIGIGGTLGANYLMNRDEVWKTYFSTSGWSLLGVAGIYATFDDLSFGASVRYSSPFSMSEAETNSKLRVINPITNSEITTKYFARLPIVYQVGMSVQALPFLKISISEELQKWTFVHPSYENISNFHVGIAASPIDNIDLLFGHSEQFDPQSEQTDQIFFTAGINIRVEQLLLTIGITDSDLFSPTRRTVYFSQPKEPFRQFIVLSAVTYSL